MSRIRKRFEKMLNNPVDIRWDELQPILRHYDCIVDKGSKGSHWVVYHPDSYKIIPVSVHNNRVKAIYVKQLIELIEEVAMDENE